MFLKSDSCRLLDDPTGPAAQRFSHYDAFLDHNHRALHHLARSSAASEIFSGKSQGWSSRSALWPVTATPNFPKRWIGSQRS